MRASSAVFCVLVCVLTVVQCDPQGFNFGGFQFGFPQRRPGINRFPGFFHGGHHHRHPGQGGFGTDPDRQPQQSQQQQNPFGQLLNSFGQALTGSGAVTQTPEGGFVVDGQKVTQQAGQLIGSLFGGGQGGGGNNNQQQQGGGDDLDPEDLQEGNRNRELCVTDDGLRGVCKRFRRCAEDRLAMTSAVTYCARRGRGRRICCPRRRQGGNQGGGGGGQSQGGGGPIQGGGGPIQGGGGSNQGGGGSSQGGGGPIQGGGGSNQGGGGSNQGGGGSNQGGGGSSQGGGGGPIQGGGGSANLGDCGRPTPRKVKPAWQRALQRRRRSPQNNPGPFIPFIVGGKDAEIGKWPWIALLGNRQSDGSPFWFCGGALIDRQYIVTAAHCLRPRAFKQENLIVRLGEYDTSDDNDGASPQDYGVERVTNHQGFQFPALHDDISIVKLNRPVDYTDLIKPICLPPGQSGDYSGERVDVAGWGYTEFGGTASNVLQEVSLPVVGVRDCQSKYETAPSFPRQFPGGFGDTKLCAAEPEGGKDACQGDSGGPMVRNTGGRYELIGVVSAGVGCGSPGFPGVYTRVGAYTNWIQQNKF